jgi:hypothetical protein
MNQQMFEFEPAPLARASDPHTSHTAAADHEASGKAGTHRAILYAAVLRHPGMTSAELGQICQLERHEAACRLSDLKNSGSVYQGDSRKCTARNTNAVTWFPVVKEKRDEG